jgi:hypothetical protein
MYPDRSSIENLHYTFKQKFSFYGWSLYSLYYKFFGVNANPTSSKAKLAELLDKIYNQTSSPNTESIAT